MSTLSRDRCGDTARLRLLRPDTISLDWGATTEVLLCSDLIFTHSVGNHTELVADGRTLKVRCPLKVVITTLGPTLLVQVRRNIAVNTARVHRVIGRGRHRVVVVLDGGITIPVGRQFQTTLRSRFGR
jgi:DNA-binding LytR/AlgR family response regulator